jgi:hypothetical protein
MTYSLWIFTALIYFSVVSSNELKLSIHEHGTVSKGEITQFYLPTIPDLTTQNKLVFVVFPLSGDCYLYASSEKNASSSHNHWKSLHTGPNHITVKKNDRNYHKGHYFLTVAGQMDSVFKILAYISDGNLN